MRLKDDVRNSQTDRKPSDRVGVRIEHDEVELHEQVKTTGGIWRPREKLWELSYATVVVLNLENRIERR
jgi:hypothetical protein